MTNTALTRHGSFDLVTLENDAIRLSLTPRLGGRVVSLVDRTTGREWLVQGEPPADPDAWAGIDAGFGGAQAYGWDECLPTVGRCADPLDPDGAPLRDHGDCWGRRTEARREADGALVVVWQVSGRYEFERTMRLEGSTVVIDYAIASPGPERPFLWSMHPLLALEPGATIELPGTERLALTRAIGLDLATTDGVVDWPLAKTASGLTMDLSRVLGKEAEIALKLAGEATVGGRVVVRQPDRSTLSLEWDRDVAPALGVWLDFGGWPAGEGRHQVALEPATSPDEDLASALAGGRAARVPAGRQLRWSVRLRLGGPRRDGSRP